MDKENKNAIFKGSYTSREQTQKSKEMPLK